MLLLFHQTRALIIGACAVFIITVILLTDTFNPSHTPKVLTSRLQTLHAQSYFSTAAKSRWRDLADVWIGRKDPARIILASVLYDDASDSNELLERALLTHEKHAERWGYATVVLRKKLVDGWWGKWSWLQALVTMELNKDKQDAAEWIMFLSPTAVLNDPTIPLSLFLPPDSITTNMTSSHSPSTSHAISLSDVHFLGAYDASSPITSNPNYPAVSTAAFFLRVHPWTLTLLQHLLASPLLDPTVSDEDFALAKTLSDAVANDPSDHEHIVLQPERWYAWSGAAAGAADSSAEDDGWWLRAAEHFPASLGGRRWKGLTDAVAAVEKGRMDRAYPFGFADASSQSPTTTTRFSFFNPPSTADSDDDDDSHPHALVAARARSAPQGRPPPSAGVGPLEAWDFWERIARARAVLREAEEVRGRWGAGDTPGQVDGDDAFVALLDGVAKVEAAMCWGAGRKAALDGAVEAVRAAMYGRGGRVEEGG
ncbi:galactosyl transferase gma12 mnn10 family protein [Neofusicoccum parvum]|uniref:Galactosyl transferase gma12 mnn10 family protein n=1 Tax=Neofusicoccum parvum TaxID=310453 RepID=A0ACB5RZ84_9PEZI|nr:galactosyl transferase gma12 mnn10 family protein [Neofusicoccum parvum]